MLLSVHSASPTNHLWPYIHEWLLAAWVGNIAHGLHNWRPMLQTHQGSNEGRLWVFSSYSTFGAPTLTHATAHRIPLYNYISSDVFKSFQWKRPLLVSAEALDTFPARWIINLLPLCLRPILDNPPCMVKRRDRERETAYPALAPRALSCSVLLTHAHRQTHMPLSRLQQ